MKLTIFTKTSTSLFSFQTWVSSLVARFLLNDKNRGGDTFSLTKGLLTVFLMGLSVTAFAQKYVKVTATGSGNGSSWDNALGASSLKTTIEAGGTVYVAAGIYNPTSTISLSGSTTHQIIGGYAANATGTSLATYNPASNQTIISASAMSAGLKRVFYSASLNIELKGLILQDGTQGTTGGAVYVGNGVVLKFTDLVIKNNTAGGIGVYSVTGASASVAFNNCIFANNTNAGSGGALVCSTVYETADPFANPPTAGKFTMTNCSFTGNTSSGQGGAVEFTTSHAWEISGTSFCNNTAFLAGGVIFTTSKKNILTGCNFTNNTATTAEGGAMIATTASATLNNCNFVGNTATGTGTGHGGAIFATTASLTMSGTTFYNNTGKSSGAIYSTTWTNNLRSNATNCIFSGNAATVGTATNNSGGVVINANANGWDFNGCTFANNTVPTGGAAGAINHYDAESTINNTIFYNNMIGGSATVAGSDIKNYDNAGHFNTITNCQMQLANAAAYTNQAGGTDVTSYGFGAGNMFSNTTDPNVAAAPSITCPTAIVSTCATPSVGGTAAYTGGTICSTANMGTINLTGQTGGVAKWQTSTNGGTSWTDIASTALKTSYNFINAANGQQYRAVVNSGGACSDAYSTVVTIVTSATACTTTTCSYNSSSFSPTITTSSNPSYTTHVVLVNPTTGVMDYVTAANSTAFTGVALGDYIMYAVTYDNTALPVQTVTAGTNISILTGCSSFSDPLLTKVCCPTIVAPTVSIMQPSCGVTTGSITVTAPTTGVTYSFDNGATFQALATKSGLAAATTYQVITKDNGNACLSAATPSVLNAILAVPTAPTASVVQPTCSVTTGTITVSAPSTGVTYSFDNGTTFQAAATSNALASGTYQVKVKDNTSLCVSTATPSVINPILTVPSAPTTAVVQPTCSVTTGTITVSAPSTGVTYSFDNGTTFQAAATSNALASGTYQVVVKDNTSLCVSTATPSVINPILAVPSAPLATVVQPTCSVATGTITVTSPTSNVEYSFDNGTTYQVSAGKNGLTAATTYTLLVRNTTSNCISTVTNIAVNAALAVPTTPVVSITQPTCGVPTGTLTVTAPSSGVTYSFDDGATFQATASLSGLATGTYKVVVQDNVSNCVSMATSSVITAPLAVPAAPTTTVVQPTCSTTTGTITVTSPIAGVTYSFDNGATFQATASKTGLAAATTYQVVVKDNTSLCVSAATPSVINAVLAVPTAPTVSIAQPTCGVPSGIVSVTSPTTGVTYSFNNGVSYQASAVSNALVSGTYQVLVKDNVTNCVSAATPSVITAPLTIPTTPTATVAQPTCSVATGTITITTPSTGVTYSFDNGVSYQLSATSSALAAGTYSVSVKDNTSLCVSSSISKTINAQPVTPSVPTVSVTQPTCFVSTGNITITQPTDVGMTYSINGSTYTNTTGVFNNVASGTYSVTAKTSSGCVSAGTVTTINTVIPAPTVTIVQPNCNNAAGAFSVIAPVGAGFNYSVDLVDYSNTSGIFSNLSPGTYNVTARNISNCVSAATAVVINPPVPTPIIAINQPNCTTSTATVTITSPTTGVTYSFDNGVTFQASNVWNNVAAGVYMLVLKDNIGGCTTVPKDITVNAAPTVGCNCNNYTGTINFKNTNQNTAGGYTQEYILTDNSGVIIQSSFTPSFTGLTTNQYAVYGINYETANGVSGLAIGQNIAGVNGACLAVSAPLFYTVCSPVYACNNATGNITSTITGQNTSANYTQKYALTDENGLILQVSTTPTFNGLGDGKYQMFALNYETSGGITGLSVGMSISAVIGACLNTSNPLFYQVCLPAYNCNNTTGNITATISGQNTTAAYTQRYALTDENGAILQLSTTTPTFTGLANGKYKLYGVNYETSGGATGLATGQNISGVTGACLNVSNPLYYQVCLPPYVCNNTSGTITANISGQNTTAGYTQSYALANETGLILQLSNTATFTGLVNGKYQMFALNYLTTSGVTGLTVGQNIATVAGTCYQLSAPLLFQVCQVPEICNNRIDDDGDGLIDCEDVVDCPSCGCDNTTGNITFTNTGQATTGFTQVYVLTDSTGKILNSSSTLTFTGLSSGRYRVYAINYETTSGITGLTVGQSINGITGSCINKSLPLLFKVCLCVTFDFKVFLEGPFQTASSTMRTTLNQRGLLPGQTPIGQFAVTTPQGQPYKAAPWNYAGTEGDTITTYPSTVVDWVLVTLRPDSTTTANSFRVTGWLHNDGHISFISPCFTLTNGAYFVVIEHRNHVGVMSPNKVAIVNGAMSHDFTINDSYVLINPPSFGQKQRGSKWTMYAGDGKKDTYVTNYDVNFTDSQYWKLQSGIFDQYKSGDFNLDADVNFLDNNLWKSNSGKYSAVPH
jgi:hypothetical protein